MADLKKLAQNIAINGGLRKDYVDRSPQQYHDRQFEYFADATHLHREQMLPYASDFIEARIQNWDKNGQWETVYIRMADVINPSAAINRNLDEYKIVMARDPSICYLRPGTKIECIGSTWLVMNPDNISGGDGVAIVRQCKAIWNHLDYYGNIVSEPIIVDVDVYGHANASMPDTQNTQNITKGYYNITCQYNDFTRQINDNTRLILGSKAYQVDGYGDFIQEFTSDINSVRIVSFAVHVLTSADDSDDMENRVAGGKAFSWDASIIGPDVRGVAQGKIDYHVDTRRNGKQISSTVENPFLYNFEISDPEIAKIEALGTDGVWLTPLQSGTVILRATLAENKNIAVEKEITVNAETECVRFVAGAPNAPLEPYQSVTMEAEVYDSNGEIDPQATITFTASGAGAGSYRMDVNGREVTVTCFRYSETPLTVTASSMINGVEMRDSVVIELEDF